jgi:hypothetical protein
MQSKLDLLNWQNNPYYSQCVLWFIQNIVKFGYNEQREAGNFCSLPPGFVITRLVCVLE